MKKKRETPLATNIVFKRKFRWTAEFKDMETGEILVSPFFVKVNTRPQLNIEETQVNATTWIPGKHEWQQISFTYYDNDPNDKLTTLLMALIGEQYDFTTGETKQNARKLEVVLRLYDGCGIELENWQLGNVKFKSINFGELEYSSSECVTIELTLDYETVKYTPIPYENKQSVADLGNMMI